MMKTLKQFALALALLNLPACQSTEESLDISLEELPETTGDSLYSKTTAGTNPDRVLEWQEFFKDKPNASERDVLLRQLKKLEATSKLDLHELLTLARLQKATGQIKKSEASYRSVIRRSDDNFAAHIELAQLFLQLGDTETAFDYIVDAKKILGQAEESSLSDRFRYKYTLALANLQTGKVSEARSMLSDLIAKEQSFVLAYQALAFSYLKETKYDLAEFVANRGIERSDKHAALLNVLGIVQEKSGSIAKAKQFYQKAIELDPNLVSALVNRASLAIRNAEYAAAERDLNQAVQNDPYFVNAYVTLGVLFHKTGRYTSAKSWFLKALDLSPDNAFARYNLASLYASEFDDKNKALQLYYEVLQSQDKTEEIEELARIQIQGLRDSRLSLKN